MDITTAKEIKQQQQQSLFVRTLLLKNKLQEWKY